VNDSCGCVEGDVDDDSLPIYDQRPLRPTILNRRGIQIRPAFSLSVPICEHCSARLVLIRFFRWIVGALLLSTVVFGSGAVIIWSSSVGLMLLIVGPLVLAGRLFPAVDRVAPDWILFRRVPEPFRSQLPSCAELRPGLEHVAPTRAIGRQD
jgi:hypothetical protein